MMPKPDSKCPWLQPGWFEQVSAWIHAELEQQGISISGLIEQPHVRPWSTVLRVPTSEGDVYCKATAPLLAHEPALTQMLWRWRPDCMPPVLATDVARGWLLMSDCGKSLRSLTRSDRAIRHWRKVLPLYAAVQIEMSSRLDELLALGALDRRLALLPSQYQQLLTDIEAMCINAPAGLTADEYRRLCELMPQFSALCEQLADYRVPETLHHDDFHDGNVFSRDQRYIFADWGESCVAHPFFTLVVTLPSIAYTLALPANAPELVQLRDIYLEPWAGDESHAHLWSAFRLAQRVGMVNRALTWYRVVSSLDEPLKREHAEAVPRWLRAFLAAETSASV